MSGLDGQARARTAARLHALRTSPDPAAVLLDWWGGEADEEDVYVRNLLQRAIAGESAGVRNTLRRRPPAFLATPALLSDRILTERSIQGLSRERLALAAGVSVETVRMMEKGVAMRSPAPSRRVLAALNVRPSALPPMGVR